MPVNMIRISSFASDDGVARLRLLRLLADLLLLLSFTGVATKTSHGIDGLRIGDFLSLPVSLFADPFWLVFISDEFKCPPALDFLAVLLVKSFAPLSFTTVVSSLDLCDMAASGKLGVDCNAIDVKRSLSVPPRKFVIPRLAPPTDPVIIAPF